jgi:hypothetical protein
MTLKEEGKGGRDPPRYFEEPIRPGGDQKRRIGPDEKGFILTLSVSRPQNK